MANFCTNCGAEVPVGDGFCPRCGNMVNLGNAGSQGTASNMGNTASQGDNAKQGGIKFGRGAGTSAPTGKRKITLTKVLIAIIVIETIMYGNLLKNHYESMDDYRTIISGMEQDYNNLYNEYSGVVDEYNNVADRYNNLSGANGLSSWFGEVFGN